MSRTRSVPTTDLKIDVEWYPRTRGRSPQHVKAIVEALLQEKELPPILVDPDLRIIDGVHRYFAYKELDYEKVTVVVMDASENEYWEHAVQANGEHGLAISIEDRREAFAKLWDHHLGQGWKNKKISLVRMGEIFCVSRNTIRRWIDDREPEHRPVTRPATAPRASEEPQTRGGLKGARPAGAKPHLPPVPEISKESKTIDYLRSAFLLASDSDVDEIGLRAAIDALPQDHLRANFITQMQSAWPKIKFVMDAWLKEVES
jgi:hypothetical protein